MSGAYNTSTPSSTKLTDKDYWRTPPELISDALALIGAHKFGVDVCCESGDVAICGSFITEEKDALITSWRKHSNLNPFFCNPPFSLKYEFFNKAIEQVNLHSILCLFVIPYEPASARWRSNIDDKNCIVYVPDGRYNYLTRSGERTSGVSFPTSLVFIVPHFTDGAKYINYQRGVGKCE